MGGFDDDDVAPWFAEVDQLGLVGDVDDLGEVCVSAIATAIRDGGGGHVDEHSSVIAACRSPRC
jgi:hypothetical protein